MAILHFQLRYDPRSLLFQLLVRALGEAGGVVARRAEHRAVPRRLSSAFGGAAQPRAREHIPGARSALPVPRASLHAENGWQRHRRP